MWININTAGTFVLHADIRYECFKSGIELPGVLTDEVLALNGYMPVTKITPAYDPITQGLSAQPCISNEGVWEQHFVPYPLDPAIVANNCQRLTAIPASARVILESAGLLVAAQEAATKRLVDAIKAERDRRKFNGVKVGTHWIHTDTYSRTQWMAMVMMGVSIPAIDWTTMDGTSVTTSQTLAGQVFQGTAQLDAQLFGYAKVLITQVEAAADPASVDVVTGWPATFEPA